MHKRITDFLVYRWRFILGYGFIILVIGGMLAVAALYIPHELRQGEVDSAIISGSLGTKDMAPAAVVNLPYHLLQKLSFIVFGVTTLSIKLPSILLGSLTALGIFLLVRTWFKSSVAILSTLVTVVTAQFLFISQDGTPGIMFITIAIWLLFMATFITRRKYFGLFWKVLTCLAMAISLYTPMGIYLVAVMLVTALLHPHIRYMLRKFNKYRVAIALLLGAASLAPLVYAITASPSLAPVLLGIPTGNIDIVANILTVGRDLFGFNMASDSYLVRPLYTLGLTILMLIGLVRLMTQRYTARSYITIAWGAVILTLVMLNPASITNLFPVSAILISYGLIYLIYSWNRIFPRNPYARVAGLVPLTICVLALVVSGVTNFISTYHYSPAVLANFSPDLKLFEQTLQLQNAHAETTQAVVSAEELPFYQLVSKYNKRFTVSTTASSGKKLSIYSRAAKPAGVIPAQVIVSPRMANADRFYIYK